MPRALIGIGSNVGDRQAHINAARKALMGLPNTVIMAVSSFRETQPVDCPPGSQAFLNGAISLNTQLEPLELHRHLKKIEQAAGRTSGPRNAPRTLDLDLLLYDDRVMATPDLDVPHPRMTRRRFVLEPLAEIAPDAVHPVQKKTVRELLAALDG